jgi:hypothetical protein
MVQPVKVNYLAPVAGGSVMSGGSTPQGLGVPHGVAPAGDADWPQIKSQLAGTP